jgi:hypothetical protein
MKLCHKQGNGVCLGCSHTPPKGCGDICRYKAEEMLDLLDELLKTKLSDWQQEIVNDFHFSLIGEDEYY